MPENRLREEYLRIVLGKYLRFSVIGAAMIFFAIAYFIYEDHVNGLPQVEERSVDLARGDRIILYTDGITEARKDRGPNFGEERLIGAVRERRAPDNERHIGAIIDEVRRFHGQDEIADDVCIITIQVP